MRSRRAGIKPALVGTPSLPATELARQFSPCRLRLQLLQEELNNNGVCRRPHVVCCGHKLDCHALVCIPCLKQDEFTRTGLAACVIKLTRHTSLQVDVEGPTCNISTTNERRSLSRG